MFCNEKAMKREFMPQGLCSSLLQRPPKRGGIGKGNKQWMFCVVLCEREPSKAFRKGRAWLLTDIT